MLSSLSGDVVPRIDGDERQYAPNRHGPVKPAYFSCLNNPDDHRSYRHVRWEAGENDVRMEVFKDGDVYKGKLLWGNKIVENDGQPSKKDLKNPDASLRTRNIIGLVTLTGLTWDGKEYTGGKIYDPHSGKTYSCKAWVEGEKLRLHGFMGLSLVGKTAVWHRYSPDKP